jgi:predicted Zn-dependent protease
MVRTATLDDLKNDTYEMRNLLGDAADRAKYSGRASKWKDRVIVRRQGSQVYGFVGTNKLLTGVY